MYEIKRWMLILKCLQLKMACCGQQCCGKLVILESVVVHFSRFYQKLASMLVPLLRMENFILIYVPEQMTRV